MGNPDGRFRSYDDFFPSYVAMHSRPLTRRLHLAGTLGGAALATVATTRTRRARWLAAFPALGYGFAWPAHFLVQKNNPATFGYPLWSLRGDLQMVRMMLSGQDARLQAIADTWLDAHPGEAATVTTAA